MARGRNREARKSEIGCPIRGPRFADYSRLTGRCRASCVLWAGSFTRGAPAGFMPQDAALNRHGKRVVK
jgi:hypothetical protein